MALMSTLVNRWWRSVIIPPRQRPWYFVLYLIIAGTGLVTLIQPPITFQVELGGVLTTVWALMLLAGGALGAAMVLTRWWEMERAAIGWVFTGLSIYAVVVIMQHMASDGSRLTQLGIILALIVTFAKRYHSIHSWSVAPPHRSE